MKVRTSCYALKPLIEYDILITRSSGSTGRVAEEAGEHSAEGAIGVPRSGHGPSRPDGGNYDSFVPER